MILWRGWGFLAFLFPLAGTLLFEGLADWRDRYIVVSIAMGFIASFLPLWLLGRKLNRPYGPVPEKYRKNEKFYALMFENGFLETITDRSIDSTAKIKEIITRKAQHSILFFRIEGMAFFYLICGIACLIIDHTRFLKWIRTVF